MIIGIGTDLMCIDHIRRDIKSGNTAFIDAVYTEKEREEAERRKEPVLFYATRFAGKEAVYKCFGELEGEIRLSEIEIISGKNGKPSVALSGACLSHAEALGIKHINISLSYDGDYAVAFAAAED